MNPWKIRFASPFFLISLIQSALAATNSAPPGIVIDHSPASSGLYIGSPSILVLPNGHYLTSHDFFGPKSAEHTAPDSVVFTSSDRGQSWRKLATLHSLFWAGLFQVRDATYIMGTDRHHGRIVIRRSTDNGATWSENSPLTARADYHTAPTPVVVHNNRLYRAFEDASNGVKWGERYSPIMLSAPADSDLLQATNWTYAKTIARDTNWISGGGFQAWLEGNAVLGPDQKILNILRVETPTVPEKAAILTLSNDNLTQTFDPARDIIDFPGGAKKFTIRFDPESKQYWTLATPAPSDLPPTQKPNPIRNTLALLKSEDLRHWRQVAIILHHPDTKTHGFQYADWQFDGADIVAAVRVAYDDSEGGAHTFHDANYLTFHRIENFRAK
jgi:hypothetical protein